MPRRLFTLCSLLRWCLRPLFPCSLPPLPPVKPHHLLPVLTELLSCMAPVLQLDWLSAGKNSASMNRCYSLASSLCAMQRKPVVVNKCIKHSCFHSPFSSQPCSWPLLPRATWSCKSLVKSVECFQGSIFQKLRAPASQGLLARFTR